MDGSEYCFMLIYSLGLFFKMVRKIKFTVVLAVAFACMRPITSCNIHVCLTWEAEKENITFKCKVNQLNFNLYFFNPANKEQGHCISPFPFPKCFSSDSSIVISQDRRTNTTFLKIHRHINSGMNGPWKCTHGTNRDKAIVNVTVLKEDTLNTAFENDICGEEHMAWTFIGFIIGVVILFILWMFYKEGSCTCWDYIFGRKRLYEGCCMFRSKCSYDGELSHWHSHHIFLYLPNDIKTKEIKQIVTEADWTIIVKLCIGMLWMIFVSVVPFLSGLLENSCSDKRYFLIFGFLIVLLFVISISIPRKGTSTRTNTPRATRNAGDEVEQTRLQNQPQQ